MCVCTCVCAHVGVHMCVCTCVRSHSCRDACRHVCQHVCGHVRSTDVSACTGMCVPPIDDQLEFLRHLPRHPFEFHLHFFLFSGSESNREIVSGVSLVMGNGFHALHMSAHTSTHMYTHISIHMRNTYVGIHAHPHVGAHVHPYVSTRIHPHTHANCTCPHACPSTCQHTSRHTPSMPLRMHASRRCHRGHQRASLHAPDPRISCL